MTWRIWLFLAFVFGVILIQPGSVYGDHSWHSKANIGENPLVDVCPAVGDSATPPDFSSAGCYAVSMRSVEPSAGMFWVRLMLPGAETLRQSVEHPGMLVAGHSARRYFLNGRSIGETGAPGQTKAGEDPGVLDHLFYLPGGSLRQDAQELAILVSCHHKQQSQAALCLDEAFVVDYALFRSQAAWRHLPALLTSSIVLLGCFFFAAMAIRGFDTVGSTLLSLACGTIFLFCALKCVRCLVEYPYPLQEARVMLITLLSFLFGVSLASFVMYRIVGERAFAIVAIASAFALIPLATTAEPEFAARIGMTIPLVTAAFFVSWWAFVGRPSALPFSLLLWAFVLALEIQRGGFLSAAVFYASMSVVAFLFVRQTGILDRKQEFQERTAKLEKALQHAQHELAEATADREQAAAAFDERIPLKESDRTQFVSLSSISHCNGARDYVEVCFVDGATLLHTGSLHELESTLPDDFIRVHRSHIVNTQQVRSLIRQGSGRGALKMINGEEVPVSRRVMPKVKDVLDSNPLVLGGMTSA